MASEMWERGSSEEPKESRLSSLFWREKYLGLRAKFTEHRRLMRDHQSKTRRLLEVIASEVEVKEEELRLVREEQNRSLARVCAEVLALQASLRREQQRIRTLVQEKEELIIQRDAIIDNLESRNNNNNNNNNNVVNHGEEKNREQSSTRRLGSFRQYKKSRQQGTAVSSCKSVTSMSPLSSSSTKMTSDRSEVLAMSSSSSGSSSPCCTPRSKPPLRLTLSSASKVETTKTLSSSSSSPLRSILKSSVSTSSLEASEASKSRIIEELQRLIEAKTTRLDERSCDSGRESDEMENSKNEEKNNTSKVERKPPPPPPPPRATTTRLSMTRTEEKHVSFEEEKSEQRAIRLLDESIRNNDGHVGKKCHSSMSKSKPSAAIVWVDDGQNEHFL